MPRLRTAGHGVLHAAAALSRRGPDRVLRVHGLRSQAQHQQLGCAGPFALPRAPRPAARRRCTPRTPPPHFVRPVAAALPGSFPSPLLLTVQTPYDQIQDTRSNARPACVRHLVALPGSREGGREWGFHRGRSARLPRPWKSARSTSPPGSLPVHLHRLAGVHLQKHVVHISGNLLVVQALPGRQLRRSALRLLFRGEMGGAAPALDQAWRGTGQGLRNQARPAGGGGARQATIPPRLRVPPPPGKGAAVPGGPEGAPRTTSPTRHRRGSP